MSKVFCKKDLFGYINDIQYFWTGECYDVREIFNDGISVYTEINNPRTSVFLTHKEKVGYHFFDEYFMTLEDLRDEKLNQLL